MIYLDTGCMVKLYYPESDSAAVAALVLGKPILHTPLHDLEFTNALALKAFAGNATIIQVTAARELLSTDIRDGILVSFQENWQAVFAEATHLASQYTPSIGCRSLDILHCAAAKLLAASEFVTTDVRQRKLAVAMGLNAAIF